MLNTSILCNLKPQTEWFISLTKTVPDGNPWNLKLHINAIALLKDASEEKTTPTSPPHLFSTIYFALAELFFSEHLCQLYGL